MLSPHPDGFGQRLLCENHIILKSSHIPYVTQCKSQVKPVP